MTTNIQPLRPFQDTPGSPVLVFSQWRRELEVYLIASGINEKADGVQIAVLKHSLGSEGQRIFSTLPGSSDVKNVDEALQLLQTHTNRHIM